MNFSFLTNSQTDHASWKRLLRDPGVKRNVLCELWKRLNGIQNLSVQLDTVIAESKDLEPWREAFVRTPAAIRYCTKRLVRWGDNDVIYLLQTTQMNGTHAELFTYCLYENTFKILSADGPLKALSMFYSPSISTDIEPGISLRFTYNNTRLRFEIEFHNDSYTIWILCEEVTPYPLIEAALVENLGFEIYGNVYRSKYVPSLIENSVICIFEKLATIPSPDKNNA